MRKKWKMSCNVRPRQRRPTLEALRRARVDAGLTISELAKRAGVSRDTISYAERGRHSLQGPTLSKIAHALGRAPSELLAEEERLSPKAESRSSQEPSLFNGLEEERRKAQETTEEDARLLRERGGEQMADLLAAWRVSKERGEDAATRRGCLDGMAELLNEAYEAETTLLRLFFRGMSPQARQAIEEAEGWVPNRDWEQVREASRFYSELIDMLRDAGFRVEESASGPPKIEKAA